MVTLAQWGLAFAGLAALGLALGFIVPGHRLTPLFVEGAIAVLASTAFVRMGGTRAPRLSFKRPRAEGDAEEQGARRLKREWEISLGFGMFLLGVALWATVAALYLMFG